MSLRLSLAAERAYDLMKQRAGAARRRSDARDPVTLTAVTHRLEELIAACRLNGHRDRAGVFVFWTEVQKEVDGGAFSIHQQRLVGAVGELTAIIEVQKEFRAGNRASFILQLQCLQN